jgi:hypothetical protein
MSSSDGAAKGEAVGPEEREELFERAKNLAANPKTAGEADRLWLTVITACKLAIEAADVIDRSDERHWPVPCGGIPH